MASSKVAGAQYYYIPNKKKCVALQPKFSTPNVQDYFQSSEWRAKNYGDYLLHVAANKSLDLTIAQLGRERFDKAMEEYRRLQTRVAAVCQDRIHLPCSEKGTPQLERATQNCYDASEQSGCGHVCLEELIFNETTAAH